MEEDAGKTAYALSLKVSNSEKIENYAFHLGQLSIYDTAEAVLSKPADVKILEKMPRTAFEAEARLGWTEQKNVLHYEIYQENADGVETLLGVTPNNYFYTPNITRTNENASSDNSTIT